MEREGINPDSESGLTSAGQEGMGFGNKKTKRDGINSIFNDAYIRWVIRFSSHSHSMEMMLT